MTQQDWKTRADKVLMHTYTRQPLVLVRGKGCRVWDVEGKEYLDFVAGLAVCNLGHGNFEVAKAASAQLYQLVHVSNLYYTTPMVELAEELVRLSFADRVFFCNSGTEAVEAAIKLCRRYSHEKYGPERHRIICMQNSFHGRTLGALSATGQKKFWQGFDPLLPGFIFVPLNDLPALHQALDDRVCAVFLEPVQGEGGVNLADPAYLQEVRELCRERDVLLVFDEVQCGLGRTGRLFAYQHFGITPDVMALAKALAGGLPMGALLATEAAAGALVPGSHASTFGGGPAVSAAALTSLRILTAPGFLEEVQKKGEYLHGKLKELQRRFPGIQEVRGLGLMWGLELDREGTPLVNACRERGLLVNCTQGNVIRLLPPLVIDIPTLDQGLTLLAQALETIYP